MSSSYETCRGNATQDKRSGRRTAWRPSTILKNEIAPATSLRGAPPKTGWADNGVHERLIPSAADDVKGPAGQDAPVPAPSWGVGKRKTCVGFEQAAALSGAQRLQPREAGDGI